jgi:hypothetical protein
MLAKDFAPDSGVISQERSSYFLRQDIDFEQGRTVLEAYDFTEIKIVEKSWKKSLVSYKNRLRK